MPDTEYWEALLRHAFEVPDHVADVPRALAWKWFELATRDLKYGPSAHRGIVKNAGVWTAAICRLGAAGDLDRLFTVIEPDQSAEPESELSTTLANAVSAGPADPRLLTAILQKVREFGTTNPNRRPDGTFGPRS